MLWLLGRKSYTVKQLRDKLKRKEAEAEVIDQVIARLIELKFVDDAAYAESFVRNRQKKKGRIALRQELFQKGISETVVDETLADLDTDGQIESATTLLEKNAWRFRKDELHKNRSKAYAFLARRGFTGDVVREALERVNLSLEDEDII